MLIAFCWKGVSARLETSVNGSDAIAQCAGTDTNPHAALQPLTSGFRTHMGVQLGCRRSDTRAKYTRGVGSVAGGGSRSADALSASMLNEILSPFSAENA